MGTGRKKGEKRRCRARRRITCSDTGLRDFGCSAMVPGWLLVDSEGASIEGRGCFTNFHGGKERCLFPRRPGNLNGGIAKCYEQGVFHVHRTDPRPPELAGKDFERAPKSGDGVRREEATRCEGPGKKNLRTSAVKGPRPSAPCGRPRVTYGVGPIQNPAGNVFGWH